MMRIAIALLCSINFVFASSDFQLNIKSGPFTPTENFHSQWSQTVSTDYNYQIIQFEKIPSQSEMTSLKGLGLFFEDYLPQNAYIVGVPAGFNYNLLVPYSPRSILKFDSKFKTEANFGREIPDYALVGGEEVELIVVLHENADYSSFLNAVLVLGGKPSESSSRFPTVYLSVQVSELQKLVDLYQVKWVEYIGPDPEPEDYRGRSLHRANAVDFPSPNGLGYDGTGVSVTLIDDGEVGPHIDIEGRVTQITGPSRGGHGDMTVGILLGAGNLNPEYEGMASGATMLYYDFDPSYPHMTEMDSNYANFGTVISSTSYSQGSGGVYNGLAQQADNQITGNPHLIHVFSAGNAGPGYETITGGMKAAKNTIATANLDYLDSRTNSSSRGPAEDGRIKPDISANGTGQISLDPNNQYGPGGGTSAACPGIAGVLAQMYQAYRDINNGANPESSLMKACLLNSAEDLGNPGPDYSFGWGRVNALRAIRTFREGRTSTSVMSQGDSSIHTFVVPAGASQVRAMVYWMDPAGSPAATTALVNNLNMTLEDPSGTIWNPWILNPNSPTTSASRGVDNLNNVEQVSFNNPSAGTYKVKVRGVSIPQGPQSYHVVWEYVMPKPELTYPIGNESFVPGSTETIRWDGVNSAGTYTLNYSSNNGTSWTQIAAGIPSKQYNWTVPANTTGQALIRITQGASGDTSDATFSIIGRPTGVNIPWCRTDSLQVAWNSVAGANEYTVFSLGNMYMDTMGTTSSNSFVIPVRNQGAQWLSVSANNTSGITGRRTIAIELPDLSTCSSVNGDVSLLEVVSPIGGAQPSCQDSIQVRVIISNEGNLALSNIPVAYTLNGGAPVSTTYTGTIQPGLADTVTFPGILNTTGPGNYQFEAWTSFSSDPISWNDTANVDFEIVPGGVIGVPFAENFDTQSLCPTTNNCGLTICNLTGGMINVTNGVGDDIDFRVNTGGTPSPGTGPSGDHTTGNGNYLYTEASNGCNGQEAIMISPCIDLSSAQNPELEFWYHMEGDDMGTLSVDLIVDGQVIQNIIAPISGNQGSQWIQATADLNAYVGKVVNIRFRGVTGGGFESDISLDDISIVENFVYAQDAQLVSVINPAFTSVEDCSLADSIEISVEVANPGLNLIGFFPVSYQVDNQPIVSQTLPVILQPGESDTLTFTVKANVSGLGTHEIKTWTSYPPDLFSGNDTANHIFDITPGTVISGQFIQDLEGYSNCAITPNCEVEVCNLGSGWTNLANGTEDDIDWRIDQNGTFSQGTGPSGDHTNGSGKYAYLEASGNPICTNRTGILESPCLDLSSLVDPRLRIWYHMFGGDMGELHFDIFFNGIWIEDFVPPVIGDQGNNWIAMDASLGVFSGSVVKIRIRGITGSGFESDIAIDDIEVFPGVAQPTAGFGFSTPVCANEAVVISDQSTGGSLSYDWDFGQNASPNQATGVGPHIVVFSKPGPQIVTLVVNNPAGSDTSSQVLNIDSIPNTGFTFSVNGSDVQFVSTASNYNSISYDFGDGTTSSGVPSPNHTYPAAGLYSVTQFLSNACGVDSIVTPILITGLEDYAGANFGNSLALYPNPVKQNLSLDWSGDSNLKFSYELVDMKGRIVLAYEEGDAIGNSRELQLGGVPSGIYILKLNIGGELGVYKIEKQ